MKSCKLLFHLLGTTTIVDRFREIPGVVIPQNEDNLELNIQFALGYAL